MTTNTTINYTRLADTAAKTYTTSRDARSRAIANLAVVDNDRRGYQDIITADGHIDVPIFNVWFTQDEKEEIAQRAAEYYRAANKFEEYTRGIMRYFEDAMVASTALALIAEVHRLIHQDSDMGALLPSCANYVTAKRGRNSPSIPTSLRCSRLSPISSAASTAPRALFSIAHLTPSARQWHPTTGTL